VEGGRGGKGKTSSTGNSRRGRGVTLHAFQERGKEERGEKVGPLGDRIHPKRKGKEGGNLPGAFFDSLGKRGERGEREEVLFLQAKNRGKDEKFHTFATTILLAGKKKGKREEDERRRRLFPRKKRRGGMPG